MPATDLRAVLWKNVECVHEIHERPRPRKRIGTGGLY